jgi:hypothetical protein
MSLILGILAQTGAPPAPAFDSEFESIATVTVGSGGSSTITFSSIPATYTHLQIRLIGRSDRAGVASGDWITFRFNSDTGSNYSIHGLIGDGASASGTNTINTTSMEAYRVAGAASTASAFGAINTDILDYANTNKYKTLRALGGFDNNGSGFIALYSGAWRSTSAVSTITITPGAGSNFVQHSQFALYGVKG